MDGWMELLRALRGREATDLIDHSISFRISQPTSENIKSKGSLGIQVVLIDRARVTVVAGLSMLEECILSEEELLEAVCASYKYARARWRYDALRCSICLTISICIYLTS